MQSKRGYGTHFAAPGAVTDSIMRENNRRTARSRDQILGCMVGGAVGDALGYPVEFMSYDAIVSSVNHSGDSDSTGAVCGNLMGTLFGRSAIPAHYTEHLELLSVIEEMATDLYTGCIISEYDSIDTPEKKRWAMKYCHHRWTPPCGLCNL